MRLCLRGGKAEHWEILLGQVQPLIAQTAWRVARAAGPVRPEDVDDIVQETCLKLGATKTERLAGAALESESSAFAYVKVMALNTARDYFDWKRRRPADNETGLAVPLEQLASVTGSNADRQVLLKQIDSALNADDRERTIFWLYYRQGFTAKEIAQIPEVGLSAKGVESLLYRLTNAVRQWAGERRGGAEKGKTAAEAL
jgi:RNA polymerase sigma-70 factor (ECF subfamily)